MNILANDAGVDGHDQLAALMNANIHPPIGETLEFALIELERGRVVSKGSPTRKIFNPIGSVQDAYAATLFDSACGCAVHSSHPAGQGYTPPKLKLAFHRALCDQSGPVRAEGKLVALGRRMAFFEARLVDAQGRLCASGTSTLLVFPIETGNA